MSYYKTSIQSQINLIEEAMKKAGVWSSERPEWVSAYETTNIINVWECLQYIHLPLRKSVGIQMSEYLAPQISAFINNTQDHRYILQLIIELDSLTSTIAKP